MILNSLFNDRGVYRLSKGPVKLFKERFSGQFANLYSHVDLVWPPPGSNVRQEWAGSSQVRLCDGRPFKGIRRELRPGR